MSNGLSPANTIANQVLTIVFANMGKNPRIVEAEADAIISGHRQTEKAVDEGLKQLALNNASTVKRLLHEGIDAQEAATEEATRLLWTRFNDKCIDLF